MYKVLILVVSLSAVVLGDLVVKSCPNDIPTPISVNSKHCSETPCTFQQGGPIGFDMRFKANSEIISMKTSVRALLGLINIPYNIPEDKAIVCNWLTEGKCPLKSGDVATYNLETIVNAPISNIDPMLQVTVTDNNDKSVVCFRIDVKIRD